MTPARIQQAIDRLPRLPLNYLPTPLHLCPRLSAHLGESRLFIKRDDLTGHALGGNKSRYLEFTLAEALAQGASAVVLSAVVQSNHCRQFAGAAARHGIKAVVVLRQDESPMGEQASGNFLLDHLFGAQVRVAPPERLEEAIAEEMERLRRDGHRPARLSGRTSAVAYIQCALELAQQCAAAEVDPRHIFIASAGPSLAGLVAGWTLLGRRARFVGVPQSELSESGQEAAQRVAGAAREAAALLGLPCAPDPSAIAVDDTYVGPGFGFMDGRTREAIQLLARTEAILVDPTYTGKAFAGLIDYIRQGRVRAGEDVVFVHTGGTPLVFAYGEQLL